MRKATAHLKSMSPYSQSSILKTAKPRDESHADFEKRVWKERCHVDKDGMCFIPPAVFKNCLDEAAKYKGIKIPGAGNNKYTKHFEAGIMVIESAPLGVHIDDVAGEWLFLNADGKRGGANRVWKCYPVFPEWEAHVEFFVFDDIITEEVFHEHLVDAGRFIGIGRFRPRNRGNYGRFLVESIQWT